MPFRPDPFIPPQFFEGLGTTKDAVRQAAREIFEARIGQPVSELGMDVHHVIPLEWAHLFPDMDPNALRNLAAVETGIHTQVTSAWNTWRNSLDGAMPTQRQVLDQMDHINGLFGVHFNFLP